MVLTKSVSLVVSFLPALFAAPHTGIPVVFACLRSETFVMGGVPGAGQQTASEKIFHSMGVKLLWSCQDQTRETILIRLAAHVPGHFSKGTLAYALPFAQKGVRITVFYDRLDPILLDHLAFAGSILGHLLAHEFRTTGARANPRRRSQRDPLPDRPPYCRYG